MASTNNSKLGIDYSKAFTYILGITLAFFGWFGKIAYEKLNSIEEKVEVLLVQNGIQKTEIENLKEQLKQLQPYKNTNNNNKKMGSVIYREGILPEQINLKKRETLQS